MPYYDVKCPHCGWQRTVYADEKAIAPRYKCGNPGCRQITPLPGGQIGGLPRLR